MYVIQRLKNLAPFEKGLRRYKVRSPSFKPLFMKWDLKNRIWIMFALSIFLRLSQFRFSLFSMSMCYKREKKD